MISSQGDKSIVLTSQKGPTLVWDINSCAIPVMCYMSCIACDKTGLVHLTKKLQVRFIVTNKRKAIKSKHCTV